MLRILPYPPWPRPRSSNVRDSEKANYPSLQSFTSFFRDDDNHPSYTNLFSVHFSTPRILQNAGNRGHNFHAETGDLRFLLDYYAQSVNLPSKQITSGQTVVVGSPYKYATGTAFSQFNITFMMPRSQQTRLWFERWAALMANDANQYVDFYANFCAPEINIFKWERGGGEPVYNDTWMKRALREAEGQEAFIQGKRIRPWHVHRKYKLTAHWRIINAFPYNIGSIQLNNNSARTMSLTVGFLYERYRFHADPRIDSDTNPIYYPMNNPNDVYQDGSSSTPDFWISTLGNLIRGAINIFR